MWALVIAVFVWDIQTPAVQISPPDRFDTQAECFAYMDNEGKDWLHRAEDGFTVRATCMETGLIES